MSRYTFPLSVQLLLPQDYPGNPDARQQFAFIAERGLVGVELNFANPAQLVPLDLEAYLAEFGLEMTYFASGFTAKTHGLSLSATDEGVRSRSVDMMKTILERIADIKACRGVIVGFFKGGPAADKAPRLVAMRKSLAELAPVALATGRVISLEATNRYESCIANSLDDAVSVIEGLPPAAAEILPDTFHMNIEESDGLAALERTKRFYRNIHVSDNNRFFPGFGAIDFEDVLRGLKRMGFAGGMAIEGNTHDSFAGDLVRATEVLQQVQESIESNP